MNKQLTIVIPVYNEAENIPAITAAISELTIPIDYDLLFVNDGSQDASAVVLHALSLQNPRVHYISFVRNFGHQMALKAGIDYARGDCLICMDGDLQHPPSLIPVMLEQWMAGYEIVITKRIDHAGTGFIKKLTSKLFYKLMNSLSSIPLSYGEADFRLLDRKVIDIVKTIQEPDLFLRGLVRWIGFKTTEISFQAEARHSGVTKYTFKKMVALAMNGILAFSTKPLYMSIYIGFACALTSILVMIYALGSYALGSVVPGWTSTLIITTFFSGIQLILLGIVGVYVAKLFMQTKNRPLYIVGDTNYPVDEKA